MQGHRPVRRIGERASLGASVVADASPRSQPLHHRHLAGKSRARFAEQFEAEAPKLDAAPHVGALRGGGVGAAPLLHRSRVVVFGPKARGACVGRTELDAAGSHRVLCFEAARGSADGSPTGVPSIALTFRAARSIGAASARLAALKHAPTPAALHRKVAALISAELNSRQRRYTTALPRSGPTLRRSLDPSSIRVRDAQRNISEDSTSS